MRRCLTAVVVVGLFSLTSRDAAAQVSAGDLAAYAALNATPIGALTPIMVSPGTKGEKEFNSFSGRYSHFSQTGGSGSNQFGATFYHQAGMNAAVSGTLGYISPSCTGCDGATILGADVHSTLACSVREHRFERVVRPGRTQLAATMWSTAVVADTRRTGCLPGCRCGHSRRRLAGIAPAILVRKRGRYNRQSHPWFGPPSMAAVNHH